jgi:hypothetical protein
MTGKRVSDKIASGVQIPLTPQIIANRRMFYLAFVIVAKSGKKAILDAKKPQNKRKKCER